MTHLGALAVVFDSDRVLLTYRTDVPVWILPGGGVEPCESLEQAVVRETREETGLEVEVAKLLGNCQEDSGTVVGIMLLDA